MGAIGHDLPVARCLADGSVRVRDVHKHFSTTPVTDIGERRLLSVRQQQPTFGLGSGDPIFRCKVLVKQ